MDTERSKNKIDLPSFTDISMAAQRLVGIIHCTPLFESLKINKKLGAKIFFKMESKQRTGSFKIRGAYNRISQIPIETRSRNIVAFSSGNHAQAVAAVAKMLDFKATIVMPEDAPEIKISATRKYGANIIFYNRLTQNRENIARSLIAKNGGTLVPPFDHPLVIAGQGTVGLEISKQLEKLNSVPDVFLVPCSGGGLVSGIAIAIKQKFKKAKIFSVEPSGYDDTARSLKSGNRVVLSQFKPSICDALLVPTPGKLTFQINQRLLSGGLVVTDSMVENAMRFAHNFLGQKIEPSGCAALAALLENIDKFRNKIVVVILSGKNVDPHFFNKILNEKI